MVTKTGLRFTIKTQDGARTLLGVTVRPKGDLILSLYPAASYRPTGVLPSESDPDIVEQRYSIHPSHNSADGVNVIKQTLALSVGEPIETFNYTKAIKNKDGFTHIFSRRPAGFVGTRYDVPKDGVPQIQLTMVNTTKYTLCYSVYVSHQDIIFRTRPHDCNIFQKVFGDFRLVIVWSFMPFPAHRTGQLLHTMTVDPKEAGADSYLRGNIQRLMLGFDETACIATYRLHRDMHRDELISLVCNEFPKLDRTTINFSRDLGYFRVADPNIRRQFRRRQ